LILEFFPFIPDDFIAAVRIDQSLQDDVGLPQIPPVSPVQIRPLRQLPFFLPHQLRLKRVFVFIQVIEIFPHQPLKYLPGKDSQPAFSNRKMQSNLKVDEIGLSLRGTNDISPFIQVRIKNSPVMDLLNNRRQTVKKVRSQRVRMSGKRGTADQDVELGMDASFYFMKGFSLNEMMEVASLPIPRP
jgi:hypothetical protein